MGRPRGGGFRSSQDRSNKDKFRNRMIMTRSTTGMTNEPLRRLGLAAGAVLSANQTTGGKARSTPGTFVGQVAQVAYPADYFFSRQTN